MFLKNKLKKSERKVKENSMNFQSDSFFELSVISSNHVPQLP